VRAFGVSKRASTLPTNADVEAALAVPTYDAAPWTEVTDPADSFRASMEGWRQCTESPCEKGPHCTGEAQMHNRVHVWVGGAFGDPKDEILGTMSGITAPNDPVFWLHHANIDRLWVEWQRRHGWVYLPAEGAQQGHNLDDLMWPFQTIDLEVRPRLLLDHRELGYAYDTELGQAPLLPSTPVPTPASAPAQIPRGR
jgi:tyrosinase